jgi:hypothetical protein
MLNQLSNIVILSIPLILLPILLSIALFGDNFDIAYHWWSGFLLISLTAVIFHALRISPAVYGVIITILILTLSIWQKQTLKQEFLRAKELVQNIDFLVVVVFVLVITIAGLLEISVRPLGLGGDALSIWLNKTKSIYIGLSYPDLTVDLVQYPSLVPTFEAFVMRFAGRYEPVYGLYFGPIAYFFWVLSFLNIYKYKPGWIMAATLCSIAIFFFDDYVINGYQDKILMMTAGMSVLAYLQFFIEYSLPGGQEWSRKPQLQFWLGTFFAAMLSLIKLEGNIMGLILVCASLLVIYFTRPKQTSAFFKKNYASIITFIVILLLWPIILYTGNVSLSNIQGKTLTLSSLFDIPQHLERIFIIWRYFVSYFRENSLILVLSAFLTIFAFLKSPQLRVSLAYLWLIWFVHSIFITLIFLSTRSPLVWHLDTSFSRLASQHAFIYPLIILLVTAMLLNIASRNVLLVESESIADF